MSVEFPSRPEQQSREEAESCSWAVPSIDADPFALTGATRATQEQMSKFGVCLEAKNYMVQS